MTLEIRKRLPCVVHEIQIRARTDRFRRQHILELVIRSRIKRISERMHVVSSRERLNWTSQSVHAL